MGKCGEAWIHCKSEIINNRFAYDPKGIELSAFE